MASLSTHLRHIDAPVINVEQIEDTSVRERVALYVDAVLTQLSMSMIMLTLVTINLMKLKVLDYTGPRALSVVRIKGIIDNVMQQKHVTHVL